MLRAVADDEDELNKSSILKCFFAAFVHGSTSRMFMDLVQRFYQNLLERNPSRDSLPSNTVVS